MERDQAVKLVMQLLTLMKQKGGSDLFISSGFAPALKLDGAMTPVMDKALTGETSAMIVRSLMNDRQIKEFEQENECNFAIAPPQIGRFRVNAFVQQGKVGAVLRKIETEIPSFEKLKLPPILADLVQTKRGLILMVGATGSGKSTTLAAMLGYRNHNSKGHIITIEDPIEFVFTHDKSIITQREIGTDTASFPDALRAALRQVDVADVAQSGRLALH